MCYLCLEDFEFELPANPNLDQKKERLVTIKYLLNLASWASAFELPTCEGKVEELKAEQYKLSRDF